MVREGAVGREVGLLQVQAKALEQHVYGGGALIVAPGKLTRTENFNSLLFRDGAGVLPASLRPAELARAAVAAGTKLSAAELESLVAAGWVRSQRQEAQAAQVARLASELPLPQLELPFCFSSERGPDELELLTDALEAAVAGPAEVAR